MQTEVHKLDDAAAANNALNQSLAGLYSEVIRFQNLKDMAGVLSCVHDQSIGRMLIKQMLEPFFDHFTLQYTLVSHAYLGCDGEYTYCRSRAKMERIAGAEFKNMLTDSLVIYKQKNGEWKVWNRVLLAMVAV